MKITDGDESRKSIVCCIKKVRGQLILRALLSDVLLVVTGAGVLSAMLLAYSLLIPVAWIGRYLGIIWGICILAAGIFRAMNLPGNREAALAIDSSGLEERCVTALELLEDESRVAVFQAADTAKHLEKAQREGKLGINVFPDLQRIALAVVAIAGAVLIFFVPSPARQKAQEYEQLSLAKKEKEEEIEKLYNALDQTLELQQISDEEREQIKQMMSDLSDRLDAVSKADSMQALSGEEAKLDLERDKMSMHLQQMADSLEGGEAEKMDDAADLFADNGAPDESNGMGQSDNGQNDSGQKAEPGSGEGEDERASGKENRSDDKTDPGKQGQSGDDIQSQDRQGNDQQSGGQSGDEGQDISQGDADETEDSGSSMTGEGNNGAGEGSDEGNGEGNGDSGSEGRNEGGSGDSGSGSGQSDFGSGNNKRDYVSIPNKTGDDENLTGNRQDGDESEMHRRQNGITWEGEHVDTDAVMGDYRQKAYEGIENGRYPEGMEDVIKNYFDGF